MHIRNLGWLLASSVLVANGLPMRSSSKGEIAERDTIINHPQEFAVRAITDDKIQQLVSRSVDDIVELVKRDLRTNLRKRSQTTSNAASPNLRKRGGGTGKAASHPPPHSAAAGKTEAHNAADKTNPPQPHNAAAGQPVAKEAHNAAAKTNPPPPHNAPKDKPHESAPNSQSKNAAAPELCHLHNHKRADTPPVNIAFTSHDGQNINLQTQPVRFGNADVHRVVEGPHAGSYVKTDGMRKVTDNEVAATHFHDKNVISGKDKDGRNHILQENKGGALHELPEFQHVMKGKDDDATKKKKIEGMVDAKMPELDQHIKDYNASGWKHGDIGPDNVRWDPKTGKPTLIDHGNAKNWKAEEDAMNSGKREKAKAVFRGKKELDPSEKHDEFGPQEIRKFKDEAVSAMYKCK